MNRDQDIKTRMQALLDSLDYDFRQFTRAGFVEFPAQTRSQQPVLSLSKNLSKGKAGGYTS